MTGTGLQNRFAGVVKIVRFNVHFYVLSVVGLAVVSFLLAFEKLPPWLHLTVLCAVALLTFWTLSSLLVSWYVYDHVGVTHWQWLRSRIPVPLHRWANVHAGLDESTSKLRELFPDAEGSAIDIYDPEEMTEPSIARARRIHLSAERSRRGQYDALPLPDNHCDTVFLLFAAHEVRSPERRTQLLRETGRVLRAGGHIVLVEHLRNWKNFLAFGPGFLHFHSRRSWLRSIRDADLLVEKEAQVTPFVECYLLCRAER